MDQLTDDLARLPGLILGTVVLLGAFVWHSRYLREKYKLKGIRLAWAALGVGTVVCCLGGYLSSVFHDLVT